MRRNALLAIGIALLAALFFTSTYVLNRAAAVQGGYWAWTAALRYLFTLPMLALVVPSQGGMRPVLRSFRGSPGPWLLWSSVGFGLFCLFLTWAASSGPSWLIAGTFQLTVIAGMLLAPLIYRDARARLPRRALSIGVLIVIGVGLLQFGHASGGMNAAAWVAFASVTVSAFLYPLGNRRILLHLEHTGEDLNATQRVFGMTLASQPFWIAVAIYAFAVNGAPPMSQALLAGGVALFTGTIATILFFAATGLVRNDPAALGATEAMQSAEIIFSTLLGAQFLGEEWPQGWAAAGAVLVIAGIVGMSVLVGRESAGNDRATKALRTDRGT